MKITAIYPVDKMKGMGLNEQENNSAEKPTLNYSRLVLTLFIFGENRTFSISIFTNSFISNAWEKSNQNITSVMRVYSAKI